MRVYVHTAAPVAYAAHKLTDNNLHSVSVEAGGPGLLVFTAPDNYGLVPALSYVLGVYPYRVARKLSRKSELLALARSGGSAAVKAASK